MRQLKLPSEGGAVAGDVAGCAFDEFAGVARWEDGACRGFGGDFIEDVVGGAFCCAVGSGHRGR